MTTETAASGAVIGSTKLLVVSAAGAYGLGAALAAVVMCIAAPHAARMVGGRSGPIKPS